MEVLIKPGDLVLLSFKNTGCNACKEQRVTSKHARTHSHSCDVITARSECSKLPLHYVVNKRRSEARRLLAHMHTGHLLPPESLTLTRCHSGGGGASSFTMFQWDVMRPSVCPHCIYNGSSSVRIDALGFNSLTAGVTSCCYFDGECEQLLCHSRAPGCCQGPFF